MRLLILALALLLVPLPSAAQDVTAVDLDADPLDWNGEAVTLRGELIGDYGVRDDAVWVQLNDDPYAFAEPGPDPLLLGINTGIGLRIPRQMFEEEWGPPGRYRVRGPLVEVTGIFRYHDPERLGETYVDVSAVRLLEESRVLPPETAPAISVSALALLVVGGALFLLARRRNRRLGLL